MRFVVKDTQPCWVTWEFEVEAKDEAEALQKHAEGDAKPYNTPIIGDSIECVEGQITVEQYDTPHI